jgi:hypothetical protein
MQGTDDQANRPVSSRTSPVRSCLPALSRPRSLSQRPLLRLAWLMSFVYHARYETERKCRGVRGSAAMGDIACRQGLQRSRSGPVDWVFADVRGPLEGGGKKKRDGGVGGEASSGTAPTPVTEAEGEARRTSAEGAKGPRLSRRSVDVTSRRPSDREPVRGALPSGACVGDSPCVGVELPETRAAGEGEGREEDRGVAKREVAPYKKNAREEGRSIVFIDESGFMLQPLVRRSWAPKGEPPFRVSGNGTIGCRPSRPSHWPPGGIAWDCIGGCRATTSVRGMWSGSCGASGGNWHGNFWSSWTEGRCTARGSCKSTSAGITGTSDWSPPRLCSGSQPRGAGVELHQV